MTGDSKLNDSPAGEGGGAGQGKVMGSLYEAIIFNT